MPQAAKKSETLIFIPKRGSTYSTNKTARNRIIPSNALLMAESDVVDMEKVFDG